MRVSFANVFGKTDNSSSESPKRRPTPCARKTPSRHFSSDSDAGLADNVYRSLSLTVSEADDETMASRRGALEVECLLLEASLDDDNDALECSQSCSQRLKEVKQQLAECRLAEEAVAASRDRNDDRHRAAAEKRRISRRQSRNEAKRHAPTP